jgi:hypothetical protein
MKLEMVICERAAVNRHRHPAKHNAKDGDDA